jgi:hypothetical protein
MASTPRLSVIRGGKNPDRAPERASIPLPRSSSDERAPEHSAEDDGVISLLDGWVRILERQARSIKP